MQWRQSGLRVLAGLAGVLAVLAYWPTFAGWIDRLFVAGINLPGDWGEALLALAVFYGFLLSVLFALFALVPGRRLVDAPVTPWQLLAVVLPACLVPMLWRVLSTTAGGHLPAVLYGNAWQWLWLALAAGLLYRRLAREAAPGSNST